MKGRQGFGAGAWCCRTLGPQLDLPTCLPKEILPHRAAPVGGALTTGATSKTQPTCTHQDLLVGFHSIYHLPQISIITPFCLSLRLKRGKNDSGLISELSNESNT